ncbi:ATPase, T2SS/T4P/T4SS family [soil metagenome]
MARFQEVLVDRGLLQPEQAARVTSAQDESGESVVRLVEQLGFVEPATLATEVARHFGLSLLTDDEWPKSLILSDRLSPVFLRDHRLLPVRLSEAGRLIMAVADPSDRETIAAVEIAAEHTVELRVAPGAHILSTLERLGRDTEVLLVLPTDRKPTDGEDDDVEHLKDIALDAPVIELVNRLLLDSVIKRATDLHIEPTRGRVNLRRRVDGMLGDAGTLTLTMGRAVVSRVKIISRLNIAERRLPQDGRARVRLDGQDYDLRVATMPTIHGEGIAIRFLSSAQKVPELSRLGLSRRDESAVRQAISGPHGLIAVTGPTGSGKTTTLAAVLSMLNQPFRKIVTIEDPVEYQIDGVTQLQAKPDIGITFASALRSFLRFDPDVMMIGEMRDPETAHIAVHAALTGHLVLTTLHTNSAAGAISRLLDMDVEGYLLASCLRCIVAQRLVRMLCANCRQKTTAVPALPPGPLVEAGYEPGLAIPVWEAQGCQRCGGTGYFGRVAIFEVLTVDDDIGVLIRPNVSTRTVAATALKNGMTTMIADGLAKCQTGLTTVDEIVRVAFDA